MYQNELVRQDELKHYGVIGMKWGKHKAKVYANKSVKARLKGNSEKAKKYSAKSRKYSEKVRKQQMWKNQRKKFNSTKGAARHVANYLVNGAFGSYTYNSLRAAGNGRIKSEAITIASRALGGPIGNAVVSSMVANDYKDRNY